METVAVGGVDCVRFWHMTPREITAAINAHIKRRDEQCWLLGQYAMYAIHSPKRYPRIPFQQQQSPKAMTDAEMEAEFDRIAGL